MPRPTRSRFRLHQLEARDCPAVVFQNDYSQDVNGFFTPARRALVDFAEQQLVPFLQDDLTAITPDPAAGDTVTYTFENTANGQPVAITNPTIAANVIRVYLWGAPGAALQGALATCGPAASNPQGSQAFVDNVTARGQAGRLAAPATDTSLDVVRLDMNQDFVYYESTVPSVGTPAEPGGDFVTIIEHELLHPLGFLGGAGGNPATLALLNPAGQFTGASVVALAGGPVSMAEPAQNGQAAEAGSHWAAGTAINGVDAVMNPANTSLRLTALDTALLKDIGWQTNQAPPPAGVLGNVPVAGMPFDPGANQGIAAAGRFASAQDAGGGVARLNNPDGTAAFSVTPFVNYTGGVRTAAADFNLDGIPDLVVGTGPGVPTRVRVLDGRTQAELFSVAPFEAAFTGGVFVAAADINADGRAELFVTPDQGGGPRVQVYNGLAFTKLADFFGIDDANFRGGARPAVGDVNGDGKPDLIVAAGFGGGPRVTVWANADVLTGNIPNKTPLVNRFVFEQALRNGAFVAAGDVNGDGFADLISGGGPGGGPRVFILDGKALATGAADTVLGNFFGGDTSSRGGIRVTARDVNADGKADVIVGAGEKAGAKVTAYDANTLKQDAPPALFTFDQAANFAGGVFVG